MPPADGNARREEMPPPRLRGQSWFRHPTSTTPRREAHAKFTNPISSCRAAEEARELARRDYLEGANFSTQTATASSLISAEPVGGGGGGERRRGRLRSGSPVYFPSLRGGGIARALSATWNGDLLDGKTSQIFIIILSMTRANTTESMGWTDRSLEEREREGILALERTRYVTLLAVIQECGTAFEQIEP